MSFLSRALIGTTTKKMASLIVQVKNYDIRNCFRFNVYRYVFNTKLGIPTRCWRVSDQIGGDCILASIHTYLAFFILKFHSRSHFASSWTLDTSFCVLFLFLLQHYNMYRSAVRNNVNFHPCYDTHVVFQFWRLNTSHTVNVLKKIKMIPLFLSQYD